MGSRDTFGNPHKLIPSGTVGNVPAGRSREDTDAAEATAPAEPLRCLSLLLPDCRSNGFVVQKACLQGLFIPSKLPMQRTDGEKRETV